MGFSIKNEGHPQRVFASQVVQSWICLHLNDALGSYEGFQNLSDVNIHELHPKDAQDIHRKAKVLTLPEGARISGKVGRMLEGCKSSFQCS